MQRILNEEIIKYLGKKVRVCGWIQTRRDHGKIVFIDLRDRSGLVQVIFTPSNAEIYKLAQTLRSEWVVEIIGTVNKRPKGTINANLKTGNMEIKTDDLKIFSKAKTLPFAIDTAGYEISEEKRLKYRYLDLRRERLRKVFEARQKVIQFMREFLQKKGFVEIETPILTKSTPEGARDFLVPSRLQPGNFYALPQSPQQYKQLLQVAGFERYFQIARCFRDEDPRADRQAEFTQLDIEMSFVEQDDILELIEELYKKLVKSLFPEKRIQKIPFPRISYKKTMEKYKSDKPDLRKNKNNPDELAFAFVVDFPMFEWSKTEKKWTTMHHPFTRPQTEDIKKIKENPGKILAFQYDLVLNGYEIGGGSLRIYKPEILELMFEIMGHKKAAIKQKFGHLLEAFKYGVPPHGGIAPGIDRFLSIILNEPNIREVIAFPKTGDNRALMMNAPSEVDSSQLKELHIKKTTKKK
ncbi:aspartate--tRNA ligase [Patescibacteria group bacterium]